MTELAETGGKEEEWMYLAVVFFFWLFVFKMWKVAAETAVLLCILFCFKYDQCGWVSSKGFSNRKAFLNIVLWKLAWSWEVSSICIPIKTSLGLQWRNWFRGKARYWCPSCSVLHSCPSYSVRERGGWLLENIFKKKKGSRSSYPKNSNLTETH